MISKTITLEQLNKMGEGKMTSHLGIEFVEIGADFLVAKMPVIDTVKQPFGVLNGGASVALAETVGSMAGNCCVDLSVKHCVGIEINANHIRPVSEGYVFAKATALHIGNKTHVWDIKITNEEGKLVCVSRLTLVVI